MKKISLINTLKKTFKSKKELKKKKVSKSIVKTKKKKVFDLLLDQVYGQTNKKNI